MATRRVQILRSAPLTDRIAGRSREDGTVITVERYGPLTRGGAPIEWVRWTRTGPTGHREGWAEQVTGARLATLGAELDASERCFHETGYAEIERTRTPATPPRRSTRP
jgi:hypothetical protein